MTDEDGEIFKNVNISRSCGKSENYIKTIDHCLLTGKFRDPAHQKCNINVLQKQSNFILFVFGTFRNYECHLFFKKLIDKERQKIDLGIIPKTNEERISVTYGIIRFIPC